LYHATRLAAYTGIGAAAGALGKMPLQWFHHGGGMVLPWMMVLVFLGIALGLDRWMPKPLFLSKPLARFRLAALRVPPAARAAALGGLTPLLPCGPLYLMFGLAMANGSAALGAQFALAFGLGTLPLLWLAQSQMKLLNLRFGPQASRYVLRGLALSAACVVAWRLRGTLSAGDAILTCH
jgi:sulfite exporter TauE/SafE